MDNDGSRVTVWQGSAFNCSSSSNGITLIHPRYTMPSGTSDTCGDLSAMSIGVVGSNYTSRLTVTANPGLNGTLINCTLSTVLLEGYDAVRVGGWLIIFDLILLNRIMYKFKMVSVALLFFAIISWVFISIFSSCN